MKGYSYFSEYDRFFFIYFILQFYNTRTRSESQFGAIDPTRLFGLSSASDVYFCTFIRWIRMRRIIFAYIRCIFEREMYRFWRRKLRALSWWAYNAHPRVPNVLKLNRPFAIFCSFRDFQNNETKQAPKSEKYMPKSG